MCIYVWKCRYFRECRCRVYRYIQDVEDTDAIYNVDVQYRMYNVDAEHTDVYTYL